MSYGVTDKGFIPKTRQAIVDSITEGLKSQFGEEFPTTPESVAGQITQIFSAALKDTWDLGSAVSSTQNRQTAEGTYLDFLARIAGLTRAKESGSAGEILFTGTQGTLIPQFSACKDQEGRVALTQESFTLNRSNCYSSTFNIQRVSDSTEYGVVIEGAEINYTSVSQLPT